MADVSGKFFSAVKVRTGVSPSSPGTLEGETLQPVNPPGGGLNSVGITMPSAFTVANSPLTSNGTIQITGAGTIAQYVRGDGTLETFPSLTGFVPYTGATQNVDLGEFGVDAGFVTLDTTPTNTPTGQGTIFWDVDDETVDVVLNGYIMKIGEDQFYPVKNQTGSSIAKGTAVRFAGTVGASGRLLIAPFIADGSVSSSFFMGVTAEAIADGADGKVLYFGRIRGINTNAFNEGDVLYASTTVAGGFQTAVPLAPNNIVQVAAVITKSINQGVIFIRPSFGSNINQDEGVKIVTPTTGQLLQLQANGLWENKTKAQVLGGTSSQFVKGDGTLDSNTYQVTSEKGQPNGYASLDSNGKVPLVQINDALIGNVNFQGLWNAATNTPTLANPPASGTKGYYYIVSTAGTFAGISFEVGDWIISDGTAWGKVDNTDAVSSVFGRTGNVTAANGDYTTSQVTESGNLYYTDGRARGALSFVAGSGAYNSTTGVITIPTNNNQITNGAGYITSAALSGYLPLTGGTLTGPLAGTTAQFSGKISVSNATGVLFNGPSDENWKIYRTDGTPDFTRSLITLASLNINAHHGGEGFAIGANGGSSYYEILGSAGTTPQHFMRGSVGINTNSTGAPLSFEDINSLKIQFNGSATNFYGISKLAGGGNLADGEYRFTAGNGLAGGFTFSSAGTEKVRITSIGNLGVGTSTPESILDVRGVPNTIADPALPFQLTIKNNTTSFNSTPTSGIHFANVFNASGSLAGMGGISCFKENTTDNNFAGAMAFFTRANGGSVTERMRINSAGNLGIGTATNAGNYRAIFSNSAGTFGGAYIGITNETGADGNRALRLGFATGGTVATIQGTSINVADDINLALQPGGANVLIGTTSNNGARLQVNGGITVAGTSALADNQLRIRGLTDANHAIAFNSTIDGPLSYGYLGSGLGYTEDSSAKIVLMTFRNSVIINSLSGSGNRIVVANSGGTLISAVIGSGLAFDGTTLTATGGSSGSISGSGDSGVIALFTGSSSIGNSVITQSSGNIGISTGSPGGKLGIQVANSGSNVSALEITNAVNASFNVSLRSDFTTITAGGTGNMVFANAAERMRVHSSGVIAFSNNGAVGNGGTDTMSMGHFTSNYGWIQTWAGTTLLLNPSGNNVLIGTTSNNGNRLRVNGTIFSDSSVTAVLDSVFNSVNIGRGGGSRLSNTRVGTTALNDNTTGDDNTAFGYQALSLNTSAGQNTALGSRSLQLNTTGSNNTALGYIALQSNTTGTTNIAIGSFSLSSNTTGSENVAIGVISGTTNTIINNSILIGYGATALSNNQTNQIVIGHNATGNGNHSVTLGNSSIVRTILRGNVLVGTTTDSGSRLRIVGATNSSFDFGITINNLGNDSLFAVRDDGVITTGFMASGSPTNNTTSSAANMHVDTSGVLRRSTSSLKYKKNVESYEKGLNEVMQLKPVSYQGKNPADGNQNFAGLIAEEVHNLGLTEFVQYAKDGSPDALSYQNMIALLTKAIQELKQEIDTLKN
jgi:hypothetical protein